VAITFCPPTWRPTLPQLVGKYMLKVTFMKKGSIIYAAAHVCERERERERPKLKPKKGDFVKGMKDERFELLANL